MSPKDSRSYTRERLLRSGWWPVILFIVAILVVILFVYVVVHPSKPKFYLHDATVLAFNLTSPNLLSSYLQAIYLLIFSYSVTLSSRNPNNRVGIYYDGLDVYGSYNNQQITLAATIAPLYQGHNEVDAWSPYLRGDSIPIAPFLVDALTQDEADGFFFLWVKIEGRLRWKVGDWKSGRYHVFVNCPAYLSFDRSNDSSFPTQMIRFRQSSTCTVDI
ncbi:NDR1/HIN1-like protein 1 [Iris pallida]|uniref:NDR1/HIN1-like protein 1 n=1 Tax=Iris pallida TaxID=29817 RepID=A0AAX6FQN0_IRIPA|nr:NDR1/HIN1-like protein 1 [Iris pallida]